MKNVKKLICLLLLLALAFSLCACDKGEKGGDKSDAKEDSRIDTTGDKTMTGTVIDASQQQSYISDLKIVGAYWDRYASNGAGTLNDYYNKHYTKCFDVNFNRDCGTTTDCIYLYEERTYDPSKAITNIIARNTETTDTIIYDKYGIEYRAVGGVRINGVNTSKTMYHIFDLNMNAGGKYIYIYVTYDQRVYKPLTSLSIITDKDKAIRNENTVANMDGVFQDFNEGAGGADLFLVKSRDITGWVPFNMVLEDTDANFNKITKTFVLNKDKTLTEEMLQPIEDKGEGSHFLGYAYEDGTMVKAGDVVEYETTLYAQWNFDVVLDMSSVGEENIVGTGVKKLPACPKLTKKGYDFKGWWFEGATTNQGPYDFLHRGGTLYPKFVKNHGKMIEDFGLMAELIHGSWYAKTMVSQIFPNGFENSQQSPGAILAWKASLYELGLDYVNGELVNLANTHDPVTTNIDYSSLSDEEKELVALYPAFLRVADNDYIGFTFDYYETDGAGEVSDLAKQVIFDLAEKELNIRGYSYKDGMIFALGGVRI